LISNAHLYHKAQTGAEVGLNFGDITLDVPKMQGWKDGIVKKLTSGVRGLLKANGASIIEGRGRLLDAHTVEVQGKDGKKKTLTAKKGIVIATGSATIQVPGFEFDGKRIIGARQAVSLTEVPRRLLVVGGGVIGLELGMVYQSFGAELTVVELTPSLLPGTDPEAVKIVERNLKKRGAKIYTETRAEGYELTPAGTVRVKLKTKTSEEGVECDQVLVAVGMKPRSRDLGLEALGVQIDPRGFVQTNAVCQTNVAGIYAIGDVSGPPMLAHKATKEGEVCAEVIAGHKAGKDWTSIPGIIFTDPEIATAGMSEVEALAQGHQVKTGKFPFSALGRAMSIRETEGFVKVITDAETKRVLGVTIVGPSASDLISEAMLAVEMTATAEDLALTIHPHPTLGEALMEAGAAALGQAIHIPNR
jgi:dihydrolipoamide dehydrogenase